MNCTEQKSFFTGKRIILELEMHGLCFLKHGQSVFDDLMNREEKE